MGLPAADSIAAHCPAETSCGSDRLVPESKTDTTDALLVGKVQRGNQVAPVVRNRQPQAPGEIVEHPDVASQKPFGISRYPWNITFLLGRKTAHEVSGNGKYASARLENRMHLQQGDSFLMRGPFYFLGTPDWTQP
jgi:hypothetical protein